MSSYASRQSSSCSSLRRSSPKAAMVGRVTAGKSSGPPTAISNPMATNDGSRPTPRRGAFAVDRTGGRSAPVSAGGLRGGDAAEHAVDRVLDPLVVDLRAREEQAVHE